MRFALLGTYNKLFDRFGDLQSVSPRKRMCVAYLKWAYYKRMEDKKEFVAAAKEFRKAEGKRGEIHRTKLEKIARKFFKEVRNHDSLSTARKAASEFLQQQKREGKGNFSPERTEQKRQQLRELAKKRRGKPNLKRSRMWVVIAPDGTEAKILGLQQFCKKMGFNDSAFYRTAARHLQRPAQKGYRAREYDEKTDSHLPWVEGFEPENYPS